jgi:hypothetical protein
MKSVTPGWHKIKGINIYVRQDGTVTRGIKDGKTVRPYVGHLKRFGYRSYHCSEWKQVDSIDAVSLINGLRKGRCKME